MDQMAQGQLHGILAGGQTGAQLPRGIIDHPLVVTFLMVVTHPIRKHAGVICPGFMPGRKGRQIGAVIVLADDDRAIDIAVDEIDQDFGIDAWQEVTTPVRTGQPFGDPDPGSGLIVARGVAGLAGSSATRAGVRLPAGIRGVTALPGKLDLDAVIPFGGQDVLGLADDQRHLGAGNRFGDLA